MSRVYAILFSFAALILALDQWTKHLVLENFIQEGQSKEVWSWFSLTLVHNHGAAFGILRNLPESVRLIFFLLMPIGVLAALWFFMVRKFTAADTLGPVTMGLVAGGALGNLVDRIRFGYVIDFIDWHYPAASGKCIPLFYPLEDLRCHWPAFNIADSAITITVILLFAESFWPRQKKLFS